MEEASINFMLSLQRIHNIRGAALIMALFVTALVAAATVTMMSRFDRDIRRTELLLNANQAYFYAQGSIDWAMSQLNSNLKKQPAPDAVIDHTPIHSPTNKMNNATVSSTITDAQGYFNLNNLTDANYRNDFLLLLHTVLPNLSNTDAQNILLGMIDWISPNTEPNIFSEYYAKQDPAYRAPHQPMASVSEFRLVKGVSADLFAKLSPFLIALPQPTRINVNNASAEVLMSLNPTISKEIAKAIIAKYTESPFTSLLAFLGSDIMKSHPLTNADATLTVRSDYFLVKTNVTLGQQHWIIYTLLQRILKSNEPITQIIWQSKGTL